MNTTTSTNTDANTNTVRKIVIIQRWDHYIKYQFPPHALQAVSKASTAKKMSGINNKKDLQRSIVYVAVIIIIVDKKRMPMIRMRKNLKRRMLISWKTLNGRRKRCRFHWLSSLLPTMMAIQPKKKKTTTIWSTTNISNWNRQTATAIQRRKIIQFDDDEEETDSKEGEKDYVNISSS